MRTFIFWHLLTTCQLRILRPQPANFFLNLPTFFPTCQLFLQTCQLFPQSANFLPKPANFFHNLPTFCPNLPTFSQTCQLLSQVWGGSLPPPNAIYRNHARGLKKEKENDTFSIFACHPYAGHAYLLCSVKIFAGDLNQEALSIKNL